MHSKKNDLGKQKDNENSDCGVILLVFKVIFSLLVVLEFYFDFMNIFDERELYVGDLIPLNDFTELLKQVQLSCFCLKLSNKHSN